MEEVSHFERQVQMLAATTFSLRRVEKGARSTAAAMRKAIQKAPGYEDGSVLVFGAMPEQRWQERQRRMARHAENVRKAEQMAIRIKLLQCLRGKHGDKASLLELDFPAWEEHLFDGLLQRPTEDDNSLNEHKEWLAKHSVVIPYVQRIFRAGEKSEGFTYLTTALEEQLGEDAQLLLEDHFAQAIVDQLSPETQLPGELAPLKLYRQGKAD